MAFQYRFDKIMQIKEKEKVESVAIYQSAVRKFEEAAEKLYELLKRKEDLETFQSSKLEGGLPIQEIRHHQQFILNMQKSIEYYQKMVQNARNRMNFYQEKLLEMTIEVKKYEKVKQKDFRLYNEEIKQSEGRQMDDISIQQYMNRESWV